MSENQDQAVIPVVNDVDSEIVESSLDEADESIITGKTTVKTTVNKRQKKDANNKQAETKNNDTNELSETTEAKKEGNKNTFIYLGPNVPGGMLNTGSVYKSGIPKHLDDLINDIPEISKMFIDVNKAGKAKVDISQQGTELFRLYQQLDYSLKIKPKERSVE